MRIIFAGTPVTAVPSLQALIDSPHEVAAVITRPPAPSGRGRKLVPSPVALCAEEHGIPIIEASGLRDAAIVETIASYEAELGVVVAYGALIPQNVLDMLPLGWVNLHFSDLPRWRGAAPVQRAIMAGDTQTASCIFQLEAGLDTGPVFSRAPFDIAPEDTTDTLLDRMAKAGGRQIVDLVDALAQTTAQAVPQDTGANNEHVTQAPMLHPAQGFVPFTLPVAATDCHIRAYTSNPGAWTTLPDGKRLKLADVRPATEAELSSCGIAADPTASDTPAQPGTVVTSKKHVLVACPDGWVRLGRVAPAGKGWMDAPAWARGARLDAGARLGMTDEEVK